MEIGEALLLQEVIVVLPLTTPVSPKRALFFRETEFVFLKENLSCLGTNVAATFCQETFDANLSCHEIFSVGSAALMIVTWLPMEVICSPSNLVIYSARLLTFVVDKGSGFDFAPGTQEAISASGGSFLLWDSHLDLPSWDESLSFLLLSFLDRLVVFSAHWQAVANHAAPGQRYHWLVPIQANIIFAPEL